MRYFNKSMNPFVNFLRPRATGRMRLILLSTVAMMAVAMSVYYLTLPPKAIGLSSSVVISQVYGGGGNASAPYQNDFIELFNRGNSAVSLNGWSVQYASSTGTSWQKTDLTNVMLQPGQYYLVKEGAGSGCSTLPCGVVLPAADATGTIPMSATAGKVVLLNTNTLLTAGTSCPSGATVIDVVGFGSGTNCVETTTAPAPSATVSILRGANGCTETDTNSTDFATGAPNPRNTLSPTNPCAPTTPALSINDVSVNEGNAGTTTFTFTVSLSTAAGAGGVTFDIATADGTATTANNDYVAANQVGKTIAAGQNSTTFDVTVNGDTTFEPNETFFVNVTNVVGATVSDAQGQGTIVNDDVSPLPLLTTNDVTLNEGNSGTTTFTFTVSLAAPAGAGGVTFDIATADGTATVANNDYVSKSLMGQTIAQGNNSYTFDVLVNGDLAFEPNETFFVNVTNISGANVSDGQGQGTITNDDFTRIHDIQGSGTTSPLVSTSVTTQGIVTGIRSNGFFMQEPDASVDADSNSSEGIFVFTSSAPPAAAALGNLVQVTATVQEFIPSADTLSPPITELSSSPTVTLLSSGNSLPTPITLTSADTGTGGVNSGSIENLEKYEGMRVRVASLTVVAPTGGTVTETSATASSNGTFYGVITGVARPFREPGIQANDPAPAGSGVTIPPVPRFDFNPERIRVNSIGLTGSTAIDVTAGATITNLVGPLDYTFRTYTILPDPASPPTVTGNVTFTAVPTPLSNEFTVSSFNLERFFDTVADGNGAPTLTTTAFNNRLNKASLAIRNVLKFPDILGVEEMENITTLQSLATKINNDAVAASQPNPNYVPYLVEGNDVGGIDVGFLVKTAIVTGTTPRVFVCPGCVVQEGLSTTYTNPNNGQPELLNDRPPLRLMAVVNHPDGRTFPITVIVVHQRSLGSIDDAVDGNRVRTKRRAQAEFLANLIQARQMADPNERIVAVGDYNGFQFNDGYVDIIGTVKGTPTPANQVVLASADLVNPDLTDLLDFAAVGQNYSYSFDGDAQTIDHELANASLMPFFSHINYGRNNADFPEFYRNDSTRPERISDHDPAVAYFTFPAGGCPTINVTPSIVPSGTAGSVYGPVQFSQTGGNGAIIWSVTSNNLPAGLTLNPSTGQLSGTPTVAAGVNITVRATDSNNCFGEVIVTLQISCPTITLSPASGSPTVLTNATAGQAYSQTFTAAPAGGGYAYSIPAPAIPAGLTFNPSTGVLSGTPTTTGTFFFTVTATGFGSCTGSQSYSLTINCATISITPAGPALPSGIAGIPYNQQLAASNTNGTVNFTLMSGSFPTGLTMSLSGLISGTPTQTGTASFTVKATDANNCIATQGYTLTVACPTINVTPSTVPSGTAGAVYGPVQFSQTGGVGAITWSVTSNNLPAGLTLNSSTGALSGTPTVTANVNVTIRATDSNNCFGSVTVALLINCPTITVSPVGPALTVGRAGTPYSQTFTQTGGIGAVNFSVSVGSLPTGLTLSSGGALSGTPSVFGNFSFTVRATDANTCFGERAYTLVVNPPCGTITITPATLPNGFVGTAYSQSLTASGGTASYTFTTSAGALPNGVSLSTGGALTGTPTTQGTYSFSVTATDATGCTGVQSFTVIISGDGLVFYPLPRPVRILDTRAGAGNCDNIGTPITGGTSLTTLARLTCEGITIPANAKAITGNVTVINQTNQIGFLTIYPDGNSLPLAANMIYEPNGILSNNFTVGLSTDGKFNLYGEKTLDAVVDVSGYYAPPGAGGLYYHPLPKPVRLLDTRAGQGNCDSVSTPITGGTSLTTLARVTCDGVTIPSSAQAIVGNATVINGSGQTGYLTIYPNGVAVPLAANIIYFPGQVISNAFTVSLNASGEFNIFGERTIDMAIDVAGYYSSEATDINGAGLLLTPLARPLRILDTRPNAGNCDAVSTPITGGSSIATAGRLTCESLTIPVAAQSILGNVTVVNQTATAGFLTLYPDGVTQPLVANMIYFPNQILSNAFVVGLNSGTGQFRIFAERTLDAIVDVSGFFAP